MRFASRWYAYAVAIITLTILVLSCIDNSMDQWDPDYPADNYQINPKWSAIDTNNLTILKVYKVPFTQGSEQFDRISAYAQDTGFLDTAFFNSQLKTDTMSLCFLSTGKSSLIIDGFRPNGKHIYGTVKITVTNPYKIDYNSDSFSITPKPAFEATGLNLAVEWKLNDMKPTILDPVASFQLSPTLSGAFELTTSLVDTVRNHRFTIGTVNDSILSNKKHASQPVIDSLNIVNKDLHSGDKVVFHIFASDADSSALTVYVTTNKAGVWSDTFRLETPQKYSSTLTGTKPITDTGTFIFSVKVVDTFGLSSSTVLDSFRVTNPKIDNDTTGPAITLDTPAKDSIATNSSIYNVKLQCVDTSGVLSVKGVMGGQTFTGTRGSGKNWDITVSGLSPNTFNTIIFTATDSSLRANKTTFTFHIKYDPTMDDIEGPIIIQKSGPASNSIVSTAAIEMIDSIVDPSGVDSVYWTRNGGLKKTAIPVQGNSERYSLKDTISEGKLDTLLVTAVDKSSRHNRTTKTIVLTYINPPTVINQPVANKVKIGGTAIFSATATGTNLKYQWQKGTADISGANASTLTLSSVGTADNGYMYRCVISNSADTVISNPAALTIVYTITYMGNGSLTGSVPIDSIVYPQNMVVSIKDNTGSLVKPGNTFSGWNRLQNGTGKTYQPSDTLIMGTENVLLYAKWNVDSFTVSFESNGGSAVASQKIAYNGYVRELVVPTKPGFVFAGWFSNQSLTTSFDFTTAITSPRTLYAKWNPVFTVTYNPNGGSGAVPVDTNKYQNGQIVTVLGAGSLNRTNYTFAGWNTQADTLGTNFGVTFPMGNANVVLYAKWRMNAPVITTQPASTTCPVNDSVTFMVAASGASLSYHWQKNNLNIEGATLASYTPPALTTGDTAGAATYRCVVSNAGGSVTSNGATLSISTLTDIDGNVYHQLRIGKQVWTMENLRTTKYVNGTPIPKDTSVATWAKATTPKYCYYNNTNNDDTIKKFGALYNWYVVDPVNTNKIVPSGWHVPTDAEWDSLQNYLIANGFNWDNTTTGNKIAKSMAAKTGWDISADAGTVGNDLSTNNKSGFSAFPTGYRPNNGDYFSQGYYSYFWSSTANVDMSLYAWFRYLGSSTEDFLRNTENKCLGFPVRLIKD
jgi:uncharacterized protein (TIGR02145 family)/uncharacterized repeat protein (TIGR02543 family)